jgi:hypothetical protein
MNIPHISYDINADGVVDMQDYKIAKSFDIDGNGVLDSMEQAKVVLFIFLTLHTKLTSYVYRKGRQILSEEFFESNKDNLWKYPTIDTSVPTSVLIEYVKPNSPVKTKHSIHCTFS